MQLLPFLVTGVAMTNPIELPARPRGQKMGSGRINGKYLELLMHSDEAMDAYGRACAEAAVAAQAAEVEALRKRAETWELLYMRAINEANGLTNYVEDRPELSKIERKLVAIEAAARAALKEQAPNVAGNRPGPACRDRSG